MPELPYTPEKSMVQHDFGEFGGLAHLGERLICIQEVAGSSPVSSTKRSLRLVVRTAVFHTANRSSILLGTTTQSPGSSVG